MLSRLDYLKPFQYEFVKNWWLFNGNFDEERYSNFLFAKTLKHLYKSQNLIPKIKLKTIKP